MGRTRQVLEIPSVFGSGVAAPQVQPSRRDILMAGGNNSQQVPGQGVLRREFGVGEQCECPPTMFMGPQRQILPPGSNPGLGQPDRSQKPFQSTPQTPCEMVEEQLARQGLSPEMLRECLKPARAPSKRKPKTRRQPSRKPQSQVERKPSRKRKTPRRMRSGAVRERATNGGRFVLFRSGSRKVCRDSQTNKFVRLSRCKAN